MVDARVGRYYAAAVSVGGLGVDDIAVRLGVARVFAGALCGPDPAAAVRTLLAQGGIGEATEHAPSGEGEPDGWVLGWVGVRHAGGEEVR